MMEFYATLASNRRQGYREYKSRAQAEDYLGDERTKAPSPFGATFKKSRFIWRKPEAIGAILTGWSGMLNR